MTTQAKKSSTANDNTLGATMPSNVEAERSVLGAILLDNSALTVARVWLIPENFFAIQHVHVFYEMLAMHEKQIPIDLVTLTEGLHRSGELEAAGGAPYLAALADGMPKVSNVEHYAKIVKEKAMLRGLIHTTHNVQLRALEGEDGAEVILENAKNALSALTDLQPKRGLVPIKNIVRDSFEHLEKIFSEGRHVTGLATGYNELDRILAGLQPSELIILAARPSHGKSSLALNITENVCIRENKPVAFFSLEMSAESLLVRLLASVGQIDAHKFRTGHLSREDWRRITEALATISMAPLWIDDSSTSTVNEIGARAQHIKREKGLAAIVVDYLQLVASSRKFANRQEEVSSVSRGLKAVAKDLGVPVLALSQLSRASEREDRGPQLSDLRESGAIEQDADVVMFIHRPHVAKKDASIEERDQAEIIVAKQRNGPIDKVRFVFRSRITRFEEAAPPGFDFDPPTESFPYKDE